MVAVKLVEAGGKAVATAHRAQERVVAVEMARGHQAAEDKR